MNTLKTGVLMVALTLLLVIVGGLLGRTNGMIIALALSLGMNLVTYWFSDKIVLAMYRAKPVDESSAPELYRIVSQLTREAGLPMPKVYIIPNPAPNAFATGRNPEHAAVAVTEGILRLLDERQLRGVLAHELSHVQNRDILIGTIAAGIAGAIMILARIAQFGALFGGGGDRRRDGDSGLGLLVMVIVMPIAALLIQMAISRSREYQADASGGKLSGDPRALAQALARLQEGTRRIPMQANPATSHLFIVSPFSGGGLVSLFSTHPPIQERVARLEAQADAMGR